MRPRRLRALRGKCAWHRVWPNAMSTRSRTSAKRCTTSGACVPAFALLASHRSSDLPLPLLACGSRFSVLNFIATIKIVKKMDLASLVSVKDKCLFKLYTQPFFNGNALSSMYSQCEILATLSRGDRLHRESFLCPICRDVLRGPIVMPCAHRFW